MPSYTKRDAPPPNRPIRPVVEAEVEGKSDAEGGLKNEYGGNPDQVEKIYESLKAEGVRGYRDERIGKGAKTVGLPLSYALYLTITTNTATPPISGKIIAPLITLPGDDPNPAIVANILPRGADLPANEAANAMLYLQYAMAEEGIYFWDIKGDNIKIIDGRPYSCDQDAQIRPEDIITFAEDSLFKKM